MLLPVCQLNSQEIIDVREVQPHMDLFVKQPDGSVRVSPPEHLIMSSGIYSHESLQFLTNPKLLENASLSDTQKAQLKDLHQEYQKESQQLAQNFKDVIGKANDKTEKLQLAKELFADIRQLQNKTAKKIETELIPFQASMIKKYKFKQFSYLGFSRLILRDPFAADLKMSKKQKEEVNKIAEETDKEIRDLIAKAREKANQKTMKILNADQRKYIENLTNSDQ